jgi:hypothetical protein
MLLPGRSTGLRARDRHPLLKAMAGSTNRVATLLSDLVLTVKHSVDHLLRSRLLMSNWRGQPHSQSDGLAENAAKPADSRKNLRCTLSCALSLRGG